MWYTEEEIVGSYRRAVDKKQQIKILSEINLVSERNIIGILRKNGFDIKEKKRRKRRTVIKKSEPANRNPRNYSLEQIDFLKENAAKCTRKELWEKFKEAFDWDIEPTKFRQIVVYYKLKTLDDGIYTKGRRWYEDEP